MSRVIKSSFVVEEIDKELGLENKSIDADSLRGEIYEEKSRILEEARNQEKQILDNAKIKAQEIIDNGEKLVKESIAQAEVKKDQIIHNYKNKGYEEGYEKGYQEGRAESENYIMEAIAIKEENFNSRKKIVNDLENEIIQLVIESCSKIINRLYDEDREIMLSIIQKGIEELNNPKNIIIKVSKEDYDFLDMIKNEINATTTTIEQIEIAIDNNLDKGGVIIETSKGSIDVGIDTQLKELEKNLEDMLNSE